jgi:hypothetical protein
MVIAHPQIVDVGNTVNIWRVPANIRISCCRWLTLGVLQYGWPAKLSALKKACHELLHKASDLNGHFWNNHKKEIGMRIGPLNVRNL